MEKNLFDTSVLDTDFLRSVYEDDRETALVIFQQYLSDLPADILSIQDSFESGDREQFRQLIHKKKVVFSYVGLTDVTTRMGDLENRCAKTPDLSELKGDLALILNKINSSNESIQAVLKRLKEEQS